MEWVAAGNHAVEEALAEEDAADSEEEDGVAGEEDPITNRNKANKMKIALAISEQTPNPRLSDVFGRSKFFKVTDSEDGTSKIICNPFAELFGGAGIQTSQFLIEKNCDVLIVKTIGAQALSVLESAEVKTFICSSKNCDEAEKLYAENLLETAKIENLCRSGKRRNRRQRRYN